MKPNIPAANVQPFSFQTLTDLYSTPPEESSFCIDGLLPTAGVSVLAGKPKAGKSTLARQMAAAVVLGEPFLGRSTIKGRVVYFAIEEKPTEVAAHFRALGVEPNDGLLIACGMIDRRHALQKLERSLKELEGVNLVIIDPVFRFLAGVKDTNAYVEVNDAFEQVMGLARAYGVHVLMIHHLKKLATEDAGDQLLGSTAIAGGVDSVIKLVTNSAGIRTLSTIQRYGTAFPETQLSWDSEKRKLSLGVTAEEAARAESRELASRIEKQILERVASADCTMDDLLKAVTGKTEAKKAAVRRLLDSGSVLQTGAGTRGAPFVYKPVEVPVVPQHSI